MKNLFLIAFIAPFFTEGQVNFTTSNLPIVVINTNGQTIVDDPRIVCDMGIIYNGVGIINSINDTFNEYNGKISIEYRGSTAQSMFPKKPFGLETQKTNGDNNNVSLLGMPKENDWILYSPYTDKSLLRNVLTFDIGRKMGRYSSRTRFCELVIDSVYQGVYVFMEKLKRDKNRIDIAKLDNDDLAGDSLTGGYIVKIDKGTGGNGSDWTSPIAPPNALFQEIDYQFHYPKQNDILPAQANYIEDFITDFEYALNGPNFTDTSIGYPHYIDVLSFIDFFIMNEISRNIDGYRLSTFLYKEKDSKGGKINMGPLWDFNLAFGNADYCDGHLTSGWAVDFNYVCSFDGWLNPFWWSRLSQDSTYNNKLKCRWEELRLKSLHKDSIFDFIDSMAFYLNDAQQRNFQKWNILGTYVWPNYYVGNTFQDEIGYLKNWIDDRLTWLDNNMTGNCIQQPSSITTITSENTKKLINVVDILGRATNVQNNRTLFYIYDDGTVEKKIIIKK